MRMLAVLLLAASWVCSLPVAGAAVPESPRLRVIGVADGLPSSNVNGMAQDRAGYLWVATTDGLARYDGVGMRVWRHVPGDAAALPGNYVTAVHVDDEDRVWAAIEGRGLSVLDATRRGFRHYRKAMHPRIGSDDTWAIASHRGAVWFGTFGGGLHRLDDQGRITRFMPRPGDARSLPADTVLALSVDANDRLWVGTTQGVARWTGTDFEPLPLPGHRPAPTIFSITPDNGAVWIGAKSGLYRFGAGGRWTRPAWSPMFESPNAVFSVVHDRTAYWVASQRNLWRVRPGEAPRPVPIGEHGPMRPMYQMLRQSNGAMWFPVSGSGLGYLRPDWRRVSQFSREQGGLSADLYRGVTASAQGGVWLAGHRGEIERLDADGTVHGLPRRARPPASARGLLSVVEDRRGRLWLGGHDALTRIDRDANSREWRADGSIDAPPGGPIDLMRLAPDGTLWLSSSGAGIQQRDTGSGRVLTRILPGLDQGLGVGDIEAMEFAPDGALWVAGETGLTRWDRGLGRLQAVAGVATGERVFAFAFDGHDTLWLQRLSGLERYRRRGAAWNREGSAGIADGIPGVEGSGLRVDSRHRVWLASLRGLFRWDPQRRHVRRFDLQDGLTSQEFSDHAMTLTAAGVLVAALADGGVVFVDTLADDPAPMRPGLFWDRVDVRRDGRWHALDANAPVLAPDDRELHVQLRLLAYENPAANRYFTKLEGYDAHWVAQGASGERVFAGLGPGDYTLRARASDAAGNHAREQVLHFNVQSPWWRRPWAIAGFVGFGLLLSSWAACAYRVRVKRHLAWRRAQHEHQVASDASLAKTRFLATLSHEVRTPMTGVLGMSELLLGTRLDPAQRGYTESIRGAGEHLLRLMNDALDLARIESGKLQLADETFDLHQLIADLVGMTAPLARKRGLDFRVEVSADVPRDVRGDPSRVRQILMNLLGNAIKFTERGGVSLHVSVAGGVACPIPGCVRFRIDDTGPGINREQQARLFQRFEQAEGNRTTARYGGSGLGLAICQELTAAMNGTIEVDSMPRVGTCFSVSLPLPASPVASPSSTAKEGMSGPRTSLSLLLVEDDPTVAKVVGGLLRVDGHRVVHVEHALAALAEITTVDFDAALLDLDLPGLDGFALARQLRGLGIDMPLIAITARTDADAQANAMVAGFDHFIRKPVTGAMLARMLDEVMAMHVEVPGVGGRVDSRGVPSGPAGKGQVGVPRTAGAVPEPR